MRRLAYILTVAVVTLSVACHNNPSGGTPTTPTSTTTTPTKIISVTGNLAFGNVNIGSKAQATFTIANSGNTTLTFTSLSAVGGSGPAGYTANPTSGTVAPGASLTVTVFFAPTAVQFYSAVLTVVGDQTSGNNAINVSGTGVNANPLTLSGTVTDKATGAPLGGATVVITTGPNSNQSASTNGSGAYTLSNLLATASISVNAQAGGYLGSTQSVALTSNAQLDFGLSKAPPTPPNVEYRITGSARRCDATYENSSGGTNQSTVDIPFSYSWNGAHSGMFLYMSCQISSGGDQGSITVALIKNGVTVQTASANGFPNIATVSGSY
jgi:hypothetical protein